MILVEYVIFGLMQILLAGLLISRKRQLAQALAVYADR